MLAWLLASAGLAAPPAIVVTAPAIAAPALKDATLATIRGGLLLPNGLDVSLGIDIQTRVDGLLVLHTVYASEGPATGVRVFTDGAKAVNVPPARATASGGQVIGTPVLTIDRSPTGTTITPTSSTPATTVNLVSGDPSHWLSGEGQTQLPVVANGPAVAAGGGAVRLTDGAAGAVVTLKAADFEVRQLIGQATGVVIANTASDRTIDTVSSVNVDLRGISPALLSGVFLTERAALEGLVTR